jgi:hypothetical protein
MRHSLTFFLGFILSHSGLLAQLSVENDQTWSLSAKGIFTSSRTIDRTHSAIPFTGLLAGGGLTVQHRYNKFFHQLAAVYTSGNTEAQDQPVYKANTDYLDISYTLLIELNQGEPAINLSAGGGIDFFSLKRKYSGFLNNDRSAESAVSFFGAIEASRLFAGPGLKLKDRLEIPFVSHLEQERTGFGEKPASHQKMVSFPGFFSVGNTVSLGKSLTDRHLISLDYQWKFYRIKSFQGVKQAMHQAAISYSFLF